ncbi:MAG: ImmA/IrrE family metallo-endopeptidase [Frankiaceae bacterium]
MSRGALSVLRDLMPIRPLNQVEALRMAELQAERLLKLAGVTEAPVPDRVITSIPKVEVRRIRPWPAHGTTDWAGSTWVIVLNAADAPLQQRFSLAHEFKHILDDRFIDVLYPDLPGWPRRERTEAICEYFAGCLLVPKRWLRQAWDDGLRDLTALAHEFQVSRPAMQTRLSQTGLLPCAPRQQSAYGRYQRSSKATTFLTGVAA